MAYPAKLLNEGEEIVLDLRPHWWEVAPSTAVLVVALIAGIALLAGEIGSGFLGDMVDLFAAVGILAALGWAGIAYVKWLTTNFVLTNDRLIYRKGVLSKKGIEIPIGRVNTVVFNQTVLERMLGSGDLEIESASQHGMQRFNNVRKPSIVQNTIHAMLDRNERQDADRIAKAMSEGRGAPPSQPAASTADELTKLKSLHEQGVLSDAEFAEQKRRLLG